MLDGFRAVLTGQSPRATQGKGRSALVGPLLDEQGEECGLERLISIPILHDNPLSALPDEIIVPASSRVF